MYSMSIGVAYCQPDAHTGQKRQAVNSVQNISSTPTWTD